MGSTYRFNFYIEFLGGDYYEISAEVLEGKQMNGFFLGARYI